MTEARIIVAVRSRPLNENDRRNDSKVVVQMQDEITSIQSPVPGTSVDIRNFAFDHSIWSTRKNDPHYRGQEFVFENLGQRLLDSAFEGYNACLFAYGQTGSGKTYTMMGSESEPGVIPRLCQQLFQRVSQLKSDKLTFKIEASYMEIYNEKVFDLIVPSNVNLRVRENKTFGTYVEGLAKIALENYTSMQHVLEEGSRNRSVAETAMNKESSRSHAVFIIYLHQITKIESSTVTKFAEKLSRISLVDLAGSERQSKTAASGDRLKEAANINKSLTTLGMVISSLADREKPHLHDVIGEVKKKASNPALSPPASGGFVPYRDSVLTWILKDNLGGNSRTVMIATISPASSDFEESLSTLRYADRAKSIVNHAIINEDANSKMIRELREELERVKAELQTSMSGSGRRKSLRSTADMLMMAGQIKENEAIIKELETPWEEKVAQSEKQISDTRAQADKLREALEQAVSERTQVEKNLEERVNQERNLREAAELQRRAAEEESQRRLQHITTTIEGQVQEERRRRLETESQLSVERKKLEADRVKLANSFQAMEERLKAEMELKLQEAMTIANAERLRREELERSAAQEHQLLEQIKSEQNETALRLQQTEADLMQAQLQATEERVAREQLEKYYVTEKARLQDTYQREAESIQRQNMAKLEEATRQLALEKARADEEREKRAQGEKRVQEFEAQIESEKTNAMSQIKEISDERLRLAQEKAQLDLQASKSQKEIEEIRSKLDADREIIELERQLQEEEATIEAMKKLEGLEAQIKAAEQLRLQREADEREALQRVEEVKNEARRQEEAIKREALRKLEEFESSLEQQRQQFQDNQTKQQNLEIVASQQLRRLAVLKSAENRLLTELFTDQEPVVVKPPMPQTHIDPSNPFSAPNSDEEFDEDDAEEEEELRREREGLMLLEETNAMKNVFQEAQSKFRVETRRRLEAEVQLEEERLAQLNRDREKDAAIRQLQLEKEQLKRALSQQQTAYAVPLQQPVYPVALRAHPIPRNASTATIVDFAPFEHAIPSGGRVSGGPKPIPHGSRQATPAAVIKPVAVAPVIDREVVLTPTQRLEKAKSTLRALTHDPSFDISLIPNLLPLLQDIVYPLPVSPDVVVEPLAVAGYLWKKGGIRRNWTRRWFVLSLTDLGIAYYQDEEQNEIKGIIPLSNVIRIYQLQPTSDDPKTKLTFAIVTEHRTYYARAESELGLKTWIGVLSPLAAEA